MKHDFKNASKTSVLQKEHPLSDDIFHTEYKLRLPNERNERTSNFQHLEGVIKRKKESTQSGSTVTSISREVLNLR